MIDRRFILGMSCLLLVNELLSFAVFRSDAAQLTAFFLIAALFLLIASLSTEFALLIVVAELVVGGKGYLYHFPIGAIDISIRLAFFVILLVVWLAKRRYKKQSFFTSVQPYTAYLIALAVIVTIGFANALVRGYPFSRVFFDVNAYLYFLLAPVIFTSLEKPIQRKRLYNVFFAGVIVIGVKSLVILGLFTHFGLTAILPVYRWVRDSGVGEVAHIFANFYRVFFQSQIFGLVGFCIAFGMLAMRLLRNRHDDRGGLYLVSLAGMVAILVSLSRSFWVGAVASAFVGAALLLRLRLGWRKGLVISGLLTTLPLLATLLISWSLYFPLPFPVPGGKSGGEALVRERFRRDQPAVSSRSALLPVLVRHIGAHPVIGTGFGTAITYSSSDPRVARGGRPAKFTTTAFEWGWLDLAVKMGVSGLLIYLVFLKRLVQDCLLRLRARDEETAAVSFGLLVALVALAFTHIFSPYLNHPLGIGIVLLSAALLRALPVKTV